MKKITLTLLALVVALGCTFGLVACGDPGKVKDEADWKKTIANIRKSDLIDFSATIKDKDKDRDLASIVIFASGKTQYLLSTMYSYDAEGHSDSDTSEYYYDGEYVYYNVSKEELGYTWQKIKANTVTEEFAEPVSYIDKIYSGELLREMGYNVTFDGLDELSERYADTVYNEDRVYQITDGDLTYDIRFELDHKPNRMVFEINSSELYLYHNMGDSNVTVTIPTESVQEVDNTND